MTYFHAPSGLWYAKVGGRVLGPFGLKSHALAAIRAAQFGFYVQPLNPRKQKEKQP